MSAPLDDDMIAWIGAVTGGTEVRAERRSAGASRAGFAVDVVMPDHSIRELWLRMDTGFGPQSHTRYTLRREASVYEALRRTDVRVPVLVAVHPELDAFLSERLEGRNWFSEIASAEEQVAVATAFMHQLATLHALDPAQLELPGFGTSTRVTDHVRDELAEWRSQYERIGVPEPVIVLALRWLHDRLPPDGDWPVVLVQGDTGPGNFLYADGSIVAVMDWEMAHLGDAHDDLGWLCVRDLQERFTHLPDRLRDYERYRGATIDDDRLRYFRVLAQARCAIGTLAGLHARDNRGEIANHLIYSTLHVRLLGEALAEADGFEFDASAHLVDDAAETDRSWVYDVALDDLRDVVLPALGDAFANRRAKGVARILKYLRETDRLGPAVEAAEIEDLHAQLGTAVTDIRSGRDALCRAIECRTVEHVPALACCLRQAARTTQLLRPAMGALADRHFSPIR
ncbi:MAG TPA: phosphotransferase family protein [Acidimicrobiales bacterium]|nr:phosphotransferase family protein [Acidimicrobiales bacterium]